MEVLKEEVRKKLPQLNVAELTTIAVELSLTIPPGKKGKQSGIFNIVAMHLMSDDVEEQNDDGRAVFEHANSILDRLLGARGVKTEEDGGKAGELKASDTASVSTVEVSEVVTGDVTARLKSSVPEERNSGNSSSGGRGLFVSSGVAPVPYQRLREFKITGGSVGGEENAVDLTSVVFQMEEGRQLGYSEREIRSGVIKAMKAGSYTRRYFERNIDSLKGEDFMAMLQELYVKKQSSDLLDEMAECVQGPQQKERQYIVQMFELRDHILEVTQSEDEPLAEAFVQKKMIRAISVGLRRDAVRLEMRNVLKDPNVSDRKLMEELNEIVARDEENRRKMDKGKSSRNANVNSLQRSIQSQDDSKPKEEAISKCQDSQLNRIESQIGQLSVTMSELAAGKAEVEERLKRLEGKMFELEKKPGQGGNRSGPFPKCAPCEREKKYCTHCAKCGASDHKRKDCTKNT